MEHPVIVVGGGIAGLATAAYLARAGRAVTVLEKATALGGRAATDRPHGFSLNRGAHALYSGGPASEVLSELGVGYQAGTPKRVYALDARGVHLIPTSTVGFLTTTLLDAGDKRELAAFFGRLARTAPQAHAHESVAEWIAGALQRRRTRRLFTGLARVQTYSSALDVIGADVFLARLKQTSTHPVHYVSGGWQTLVDGLREAASRAGVTIQTSAGAERIEVLDGLASGVQLHGGEHVPAADVVLAVPPDDALRLLGSQAAPRLAQIVSDMAPGHVAALDVALRSLPSRTYPVVFDLEQPRFLTVQSTVAELAPKGGAVIHAFTQPDFRTPEDPATARSGLEAMLDQFQPGWRELVVKQRFLPRMLGTSALPLVSQGSMAGRAAHRSQDVSNVYFAGDWIGPRGYLVDTSLDSARETARLVLGVAQQHRHPVLQAA